jgi:hypothetical protein
VLWSGRNTRNDVLPIVGPSGNEAAPALDEFLTRLFDPERGSWEVLSSVSGPGPGVKLDPRVVDATKQEPTPVYERDGIKVTAMGTAWFGLLAPTPMAKCITRMSAPFAKSGKRGLVPF